MGPIFSCSVVSSRPTFLSSRGSPRPRRFDMASFRLVVSSELRHLDSSVEVRHRVVSSNRFLPSRPIAFCRLVQSLFLVSSNRFFSSRPIAFCRLVQSHLHGQRTWPPPRPSRAGSPGLGVVPSESCKFQLSSNESCKFRTSCSVTPPERETGWLLGHESSESSESGYRPSRPSRRSE